MILNEEALKNYYFELLCGCCCKGH